LEPASGGVLILGPRSAYGAALFIRKKICYLWLSEIALHAAAQVAKRGALGHEHPLKR
jgi:hypothetical protein